MSTILIIDDMIQTLKYLSLYLSKDGFEVRSAKSYVDGLEILDAERIDLILLDVMMPGVDGLESCRRLKKSEKYADIPVIFVTSCDSGDAIKKCFDAGGVDYVYKFATQRELLARVKTQLKLSAAQNHERLALMRFSKALDVFPSEILTVDANGRIIFMNASLRELLAQKVKTLSEMDEGLARMMGADLVEGVLKNKEMLEVKKTFGNVTRIITIVPVVDERVNESEFLFIVSRDVSEVEEMEFHLRQSKKMESVSVIAGGAAHDLNNILGGMLGYTSMARMHCDSGLVEEFIIKAESAAEKAAAVISQLLNFASHKDPQVETVCARTLVHEAVKLLDSSMQTKRRIWIEASESDYYMRVDNYLVQQALLNILIALEKSIPEDSSIKITLSSTFKRDTLLPFRDEDIFGDYIKIIVVDEENYNEGVDGSINIDRKKNQNVVAGLGVAIVSGIVKDFGGLFYIHGDPQKPTGFTVCFPLVEPEERVITEPDKVSNTAHILVLDNETLFVQMVKDLMDLLGYEATFCDSGKECLNVYLDKAKSFDVLMVDYGEKEMLPVEIMEKFAKANPDLKILLTSSKQVEEVSMIADLQSCAFIEKPFKMKEFSDLLANLLS